eukprot:gene5791-8675_t
MPAQPRLVAAVQRKWARCPCPAGRCSDADHWVSTAFLAERAGEAATRWFGDALTEALTGIVKQRRRPDGDGDRDAPAVWAYYGIFAQDAAAEAIPLAVSVVVF